MAKMKMLKYPKKPKASASTATLENYLRRCKEVDSENKRRKADASKKEALRKKVASIGRAK